MKPIVALSTPRMNNPIHIIRISGDDIYSILQKICLEKITKKGYTIQKVTIIDNGNKIDEVLLNKFVAPKSYTGEDLIEINSHGSVYIADKIINLLIKNGCRQALRGEFSQRAFLNKKMSLAQSKAVHNLVNSYDKYSHKHAIGGLDNKTQKILLSILDKLKQNIGQVEVNIDYPEYEQTPDVSHEKIIQNFREIIEQIKIITSSSKIMLSNSKGINIAIVGEPNAGKSSLLNLLSNEQKAIVSNIPGTTRDYIENKILIDDILFNFIDTAGIRKSSNIIEKKGIVQTKKIINKATYVIYLLDGSKPLSKNHKKYIALIPKQKLILVNNKSDLANKNKLKSVISISVKKKNIKPLIDKLISLIEISPEVLNSSYVQDNEDIVKLEKVLKLTKQAYTLYNDQKLNELIYDKLFEAIETLNEVLGNSEKLDFVNLLFSKFCVGK